MAKFILAFDRRPLGRSDAHPYSNAPNNMKLITTPAHPRTASFVSWFISPSFVCAAAQRGEHHRVTSIRKFGVSPVTLMCMSSGSFGYPLAEAANHLFFGGGGRSGRDEFIETRASSECPQRSSAQIGKSPQNLNHQLGDLTWVFFLQQRPKLRI